MFTKLDALSRNNIEGTFRQNIHTSDSRKILQGLIYMTLLNAFFTAGISDRRKPYNISRSSKWQF